MSHKERGATVIFNQEKFCPSFKISQRHGRAKDKNNLADVLHGLYFDVRSFDDLTVQQIKQKLAARRYQINSCNLNG